MRKLFTVDEVRTIRASLKGSVGLVPTMGALHKGHLSLIDAARSQCDHIAVSIFVNPAQFGPNEDYAAYPRSLDRDLRLLEGKVDLVWLPAPEAVYPPGFQSWVTVEQLSRPLEGASRPGHFRGVATVVAKLFNVLSPDRAYFGQKDAQQAAVIKRMAADLNFPLEIMICPTVREADGLAVSSRNAYLNAEERQAASVLHRALSVAARLFDGGERDAEKLRAAMRSTIDSEPLARPDYISVADPETLEECAVAGEHVLLSMAVRIGRARLIDNEIR